MDPSTVLEASTVAVAPETYAVLTADGEVPGAFATVDDGRETTHVVPEARLPEIDATAVERGWTLLTFDADLPFDLVGFLARVTAALADRDVPVFAVSAYSTDHVLVPEDDADRALSALSALGCAVRRR